MKNTHEDVVDAARGAIIRAREHAMNAADILAVAELLKAYNGSQDWLPSREIQPTAAR